MPQSRAGDANRRGFYGWYIVGATFVTLGIAVGVPYYNLPFFYDYFQRAYHWDVRQITLGFPLAALLTLWVGPAVVPRYSPRKLIIAGTALTALSFFGFSAMRGGLAAYFALYFIYTAGYILSGPIPHQILVSYWFRRRRGSALGIMYVGIGLFGGLGSLFVRGITDAYGFWMALIAVGALMFLTWPIAVFLLRDRPSELGQFPDGAPEAAAEIKATPHAFGALMRSWAFWLLMIGSVCSIGAVGSINLHMKFVFRDEGFRNQKLLDAVWTTASVLILWSSIAGRLSVGYLSDIFSKKTVMSVAYVLVAITSLLLLSVAPGRYYCVYLFSVIFGFAMGADYMLIPLMAAEQFGVNTLARAMAVILPINTIGQTWCPYLVSKIRQESGSYAMPMAVVFGIALLGAIAVAAMPKKNPLASFDTSLVKPVQSPASQA